MFARLSNLLTCERGVMAIIFALVLIPLMLIAGMAVDYTQINSDKAALQEHLDSAVLAGSSQKDVEDPKERLKIAEQHFKVVLPPNLAALPMQITFELTKGDVGIRGTVTTQIPTRIMSFFGWTEANVYLTSATNISQPNRQLDMVFCIDATGSMQETIDSVRNNARSLEESMNKELSRRGYSQFGAIRARVIFFRDYGPDQGDPNAYVPGTWDEKNRISNQPPMRESKYGQFYTLPDEREPFRQFLENETAFGGGDEPESGFVCLNQAINSDWSQPGERMANVSAEKITVSVPMIVIWTDANVLPLDDGWSETNPLYPRNMPRYMTQLRAAWRNQAVIDQEHKVLVFFGDTNNASKMLSPRPNADPEPRWKEIEAWDDYTWGGTLTDANKDLVTKLVDALSKSPAMPRLTE